MKHFIAVLFLLSITYASSTFGQTYTKAQMDSLLKVKIDSILHHTHNHQQNTHPKKVFEYALGLDGSLNFGNLNRYIISSRNNFSLVGGKQLWFSLSPYFALGELNGKV
jgi:hypothetical protein